MMKRILMLALPAAFLTGCVAADARVGYATFEVPLERGPGFCENYAEETYFNAYEDLYDSEDGFGARSYARSRAERAADRAYERCLSGRLN